MDNRATQVFQSTSEYVFDFTPKPTELDNSPKAQNARGLAANRSKYCLGFSVKEYRKNILLNARVLRAAWMAAHRRKDLRAIAMYEIKYTDLLERISEFKSCF